MLSAISIEGMPQPFNEPTSDFKSKFPTPLKLTTEDQWLKHLEKLKIFTLVANLRGDPSPDENKMNGSVLGIKNVDLSDTYIDFQVGAETKTSPSVPSSPLIGNHVLENNSHEEVVKTKISTKAVQKCPNQLNSSKNQDSNESDEIKPNVQETCELKTQVKELNNEIKTENKLAETPVQPENTKQSISKTKAKPNGTHRPLLRRSKGSLLASKPPNVLVYSESNVTRNIVIETLKVVLDRDM